MSGSRSAPHPSSPRRSPHAKMNHTVTLSSPRRAHLLATASSQLCLPSLALGVLSDLQISGCFCAARCIPTAGKLFGGGLMPLGWGWGAPANPVSGQPRRTAGRPASNRAAAIGRRPTLLDRALDLLGRNSASFGDCCRNLGLRTSPQSYC